MTPYPAYIRLEQLVQALEDELRKNERFLRQTNHFYAQYQDQPYTRMYAWLEEARQEIERICTDRPD